MSPACGGADLSGHSMREVLPSSIANQPPRAARRLSIHISAPSTSPSGILPQRLHASRPPHWPPPCPAPPTPVDQLPPCLNRSSASVPASQGSNRCEGASQRRLLLQAGRAAARAPLMGDLALSGVPRRAAVTTAACCDGRRVLKQSFQRGYVPFYVPFGTALVFSSPAAAPERPCRPASLLAPPPTARPTTCQRRCQPSPPCTPNLAGVRCRRRRGGLGPGLGLLHRGRPDRLLQALRPRHERRAPGGCAAPPRHRPCLPSPAPPDGSTSSPLPHIHRHPTPPTLCRWGPPTSRSAWLSWRAAGPLWPRRRRQWRPTPPEWRTMLGLAARSTRWALPAGRGREGGAPSAGPATSPRRRRLTPLAPALPTTPTGGGGVR